MSQNSGTVAHGGHGHECWAAFRFLIKDQEQFKSESAAVVRAGLASSPWQHLDSTATRVGGKNEQCHVLCNPFYTAYFTVVGKDRLSLVRVLLGGADPVFRLNELALTLLKQLGLAQKWCKKLTELFPHEQIGRKTSSTNGSMSTCPNWGRNCASCSRMA